MIHPTAIVSPKAELGSGVRIGAYCVVDEARIGDDTVLEPYSRVCSYVEMGKGNQVHSHAVIGGDPQDHGYRGEKSFARIGDGNIFREYVTVNRATGEGYSTSIGNDCLLMEGVHVGHNADIKNKVTIANKVGISGFVQIDDYTVIGGIVGIHQFVRIGSYCMVGGMYKVVKDIPHFTLAAGEPLRLKGLNVIGLRRANFSSDLRKKIKALYRELYDKSKMFSSSLENQRAKLGSSGDTPLELIKILDFYKDSKRGITFWGGKSSSNSSDD
ncbi:MAG: acyl-ACP--UDP-N-acetylglucosamine O-acyltransferase [Synergistaceae bacterium]|nr:acyl-ACP--UDP-N-acetylglucosamine O-acyltransferase [Synergistaceae bacterium]